MFDRRSATTAAAILSLLLLPMSAASAATPARGAHSHRSSSRAHRRHHQVHARRHRKHRRRHHRRHIASTAVVGRPFGARRGTTTKGSPTSVSRPSSGLPAAGASLAPVVHNPTITGTTYYVSPAGSDSNSGTSPTQAWRTVTRVNHQALQPGDAVLFQGGATFADAGLMPGYGSGVNGTDADPVVFGSFGTGNAALPDGIWFSGDNDLTFENLSVPGSGAGGSEQGLNGTGNNIAIQGCSFSDVTLGIQSHGSNWTIADNTVTDTGDSGLLLYGDSHTVTGNTITATGLDHTIPYGTHGIYLKAPNSTVSYNTITNFNYDGISDRYRNSTITNNRIVGGQIGIAWFEYDTIGGVSKWSDNRIEGTTVAGMFVSGDATTNLERFVITGNTISVASGVVTNFHPTSAAYEISDNSFSSS
jgi:hypothetical protein